MTATTYNVQENFTTHVHRIPGVGLFNSGYCIKWDNQLFFTFSDARYMAGLSEEALTSYLNKLSDFYTFGSNPALHVCLDFIYTVLIYEKKAPPSDQFYQYIENRVM